MIGGWQDWSARHPLQISVKPTSGSTGANHMSRVIKMSTPKRKPASLPKTAALTKAQADHRKWLKAHGIKATKNSLRT
jgi:hypothetical protein